MSQEAMSQDFPLSVKCESSDTVVFVACPRGGRYGDVRKTLAALLQRSFASINLAPCGETTPYDDNTPVEGAFENCGVILPATILGRDETGTGWIAE